MLVIKYIIGIMIPFIMFLMYWSMAMYNPFKTILIVGKKGSGKSTDIVKRCLQNNGKKFWYYDKDAPLFHRWKRAEWRIYSSMKVNMPFRVYKVNLKQLGDLIPKPFSYVLLDEINLVWDNRKFKEFKESTQEFFRLARKNRCKVVMYSQTFDCDRPEKSENWSMKCGFINLNLMLLGGVKKSLKYQISEKME